MPLDPSLLSESIHSLLISVPIGESPNATVSTSDNGDGTSTTTVSPPVMVSEFMKDPMARVISDAIAKAVISHIMSSSLISGANGAGPVISTIT